MTLRPQSMGWMGAKRGTSMRLVFFCAMAFLGGFVATPAASAQEAAGAESPVDKEKRLLGILETNPENAGFAHELGTLYYDQGKRDKAIEYYRRAIELRPGHFEATVDLGIVLNESGQSEAALAEFDKALGARPENIRAICYRGQALYALRRYEEALEHYQRAARIDPRSQLAHYLIGIAFADAGIYREAIVEWETVVEINPETEQAATAKQGIEVLRGLLPEG